MGKAVLHARGGERLRFEPIDRGCGRTKEGQCTVCSVVETQVEIDKSEVRRASKYAG